MDKPYYLAYEERYQTAFAAGIDYWGHDPGDTTLAEALDGWVRANRLSGRRVIEFACGEGAPRAFSCPGSVAGTWGWTSPRRPSKRRNSVWPVSKTRRSACWTW